MIRNEKCEVLDKQNFEPKYRMVYDIALAFCEVLWTSLDFFLMPKKWHNDVSRWSEEVLANGIPKNKEKQNNTKRYKMKSNATKWNEIG